MSAFRSAVITFPGSNCDRDMAVALEQVCGGEVFRVWHGDAALPDRLDFIALPGGFSYGDYLRSGAMAARSPVMQAVIAAAGRGVPVLGVCNGFQVLTECGLLPGALVRNAHLRFECRDVFVRPEGESRFVSGLPKVLRLPIAHAEGRYQCDDETFARLEGEGRIALRYCGPDGTIDPATTVNGSRSEIAGVYNAQRNVMGLMPHPERASETVLGNDDGRRIFESLSA